VALPAMLSALRELILDGGAVPENIDERLVAFKRRFSTLSPEEVQDLAKIDFEGLQKYSHSIYAAESKILDHYFPVTCAYLKHHWRATRQSEFGETELAQLVHGAAPWRGIHSEVLGESFVQFLRTKIPDIIDLEPGLIELAQLELACMQIRKGRNESVSPQEELSLERVEKLPVEDFLAHTLYIPNLVRVLHCQYDVITAREQYVSEESDKLPAVAQRSFTVIGGRPLYYGVTWIEIAPILADQLNRGRGILGDGAISIGDLAEIFVTTAGAGEESVLFVQFMGLLSRLIQGGVVVIKW